jgi:stalled ribosome alternative rescue factor ArfA
VEKLVDLIRESVYLRITNGRQTMQIKGRNPIARALRDGSLRPKAVRPKKGRGSYTRKGREDRAA